jgi:hypothetical protein
MRYNPNQKTRDERFPKRDPEDTGDKEREHEGRRDVYDSDIE